MAKNQAIKRDDWDKFAKLDDFTILEQDLSYKDIVDWKSIESLEIDDAEGP